MNSAPVQNTISTEFLINWIFVILVHKESKSLFDTPGRDRGMETFKFSEKQRNQQKDIFSSMLCTAETIL